MKTKTSQKTRRLAQVSILIAVVLVQNFVPLVGYVPVGPLSLTLIHVTVLIGAVAFGWKSGALVGLAWGLITWVRAFIAPTSPLAVIVMVNPLISVLPRVLLGIVGGMAFALLVRHCSARSAAVIAAGLGALTNTVLVLGQIALFYGQQSQALYHLNISALVPYLLGVAATNGVGELIIASVIVPLVAVPLRRYVQG